MAVAMAVYAIQRGQNWPYLPLQRGNLPQIDVSYGNLPTDDADR